MSKQKVGVIAGCIVGGLALVGGAFWFGANYRLSKVGLNDSLAMASESSSATENVIPLGGDGPATDESGGLSVSNGGASNLGQLGGSGGQNPAGGSNSGTNGGNGAGTSGVNPATFGEYEKYKNEQHALFGEIKVGSGAELTANKKAVVLYKGWLTSGQMFDQSRTGSDGKLQPFTFTLGAGQVVRGWEEGLAGMKVGGSRLIIVPPAVGYGAQGQGSIPPNAVMVFQVQLVDVQ